MRAVAGGLLLSCLLAVAIGASAADAPPLRLGVYPLVETTDVVRMFTPLARHIESRTGRKIVVHAAATYDEHLERVGADRCDLAYVSPAAYLAIRAKHGPKPVVAQLETHGASTYRGVIVARHDGGIASLSQLRGRRFAFGDRRSTMGYVVPRHMLWKAGIGLGDLGSYEFMPNQEDVALAILSGLCDAGAVREQVFESFAGRGLKAVAWSTSVPEHLFVASPRLDGATLAALRDALLSLAGTPGGRRVLESFQKSATGLVPANERDLADFESIVRDVDALGGK